MATVLKHCKAPNYYVQDCRHRYKVMVYFGFWFLRKKATRENTKRQRESNETSVMKILFIAKTFKI